MQMLPIKWAVVPLMTRALADGDMSLLRQVATDRMQEPYRAELIPDYSAAHQVVQTAGGVLLISGSGSTMLAITDSSAAAAQLQAQAQESWKSGKYRWWRQVNKAYKLNGLSEFQKILGSHDLVFLIHDY